jgi:hypothetical protein
LETETGTSLAWNTSPDSTGKGADGWMWTRTAVSNRITLCGSAVEAQRAKGDNNDMIGAVES